MLPVMIAEGTGIAGAIPTVVGWAEDLLSSIIGNEYLVVFLAIGIVGSVLGLVERLIHTR